MSGFRICVGDLREIALSHQCRRHRDRRTRQTLGAHAFVRAHEERFVPAVVQTRNHDRAVDLGSELFPVARILGQGRIVEIPARIERIILREVKDRPVEIVGAALGDHVDVDAEIRTELSRRAAGLHLNLGHGLGDRPHAGRRQQVGRGIDAVERQAVLDLALAGAPEALADIAGARRQHAGCRLSPDSRRCGRCSGSSTIARSLIVSETVARSVFNTCAADSTLTDSVIAPTASVAFVRTTWLVFSSTPVVLNVWKPAMRDGDFVPARACERDVVITLVVRRGFVGVFRARVDCHHLRSGDDEAAAVGHCPDKGRLRRELRPSAAREK